MRAALHAGMRGGGIVELEGRIDHWRGLKGDLHDAAFDGGGVVVAIDVFAANHVEDDVGAAVAGCLLGCGDEIFGLVVNGDIGAERYACGAFFRP